MQLHYNKTPGFGKKLGKILSCAEISRLKFRLSQYLGISIKHQRLLNISPNYTICNLIFFV